MHRWRLPYVINNFKLGQTPTDYENIHSFQSANKSPLLTGLMWAEMGCSACRLSRQTMLVFHRPVIRASHQALQNTHRGTPLHLRRLQSLMSYLIYVARLERHALVVTILSAARNIDYTYIIRRLVWFVQRATWTLFFGWVAWLNTWKHKRRGTKGRGTGENTNMDAWPQMYRRPVCSGGLRPAPFRL